jgi:CubicO group peptidase (beta-lactamase class C family)
MPNRLRLSVLVLVLALLPVLAPASAAASPDVAGHWEGAIALPTGKLEVDVDLAKLPDGTWKGDISIPAQGAKDLPLADIKAEGANVAFAISGIPGNPVFKGQMSPDGAKITGSFTQGAGTFPFELARAANPAAKARQALEGFDTVVTMGLDELRVPGAAIAVVKDKEVILAKGFGYRDVDKKLPVTADTLMAIGSSTKAFTAFVLGTLVDKGQVEWDAPVRDYIPWFRLLDAQAGERLTPRDLVTHRSGLPRHDLLWYNNHTATREALVRSLAYLQPSADLREKWQYNNLMFLTAGYLVETMTGRSWEANVRSLVFEPLGMTRSNFSVAESQKDADFAFPYDERDGKVQKIPFRDITTIGPAGSINSSVNEMSRWVSVHINGGKLGDAQIIGADTLADLHRPYMTTGTISTRPDITSFDYALGWMVDNYRGHNRVYHGGNIDGFSALVSLWPDDGLGFVILTNKNGTGLPELLVRTAADRILGLEAVDWIGDAAKKIAAGREVGKKAEENKTARRRPGTVPAHKLEEYAGDYRRLRRPRGHAQGRPARLRLQRHRHAAQPLAFRDLQRREGRGPGLRGHEAHLPHRRQRLRRRRLDPVRGLGRRHLFHEETRRPPIRPGLPQDPARELCPAHADGHGRLEGRRPDPLHPRPARLRARAGGRRRVLAQSGQGRPPAVPCGRQGPGDRGRDQPDRRRLRIQAGQIGGGQTGSVQEGTCTVSDVSPFCPGRGPLFAGLSSLGAKSRRLGF